MPAVLEKNQQFFTEYPELLNRSAHAMVTVDGVDKKTKEREIRKVSSPSVRPSAC